MRNAVRQEKRINLNHNIGPRLTTSRRYEVFSERSEPLGREAAKRESKSREVFVPRHIKSDEGPF